MPKNFKQYGVRPSTRSIMPKRDTFYTFFYFLRSEGRAAAHEKLGLNALLNARLPSFLKNFVTFSPCFLYNSTQTNKDVKN